MEKGNVSCPVCGGSIIGDGFTSVRHCENTNIDISCVEPDANTIYCKESTVKRKKAMCPVCGEREAQDCGYGEYDGQGDFDCTHEKAGEYECPCGECACSVCKIREAMLYDEKAQRRLNFLKEGDTITWFGSLYTVMKDQTLLGVATVKLQNGHMDNLRWSPESCVDPNAQRIIHEIVNIPVRENVNEGDKCGGCGESKLHKVKHKDGFIYQCNHCSYTPNYSWPEEELD